MKILFAGASGDRYGADAVLREIAAHFSAQGADCILVLPNEGPGKELAEERGLRLQILPMPVLRRSDLNRRGLLRLITRLLPSSVSHLRILRRERPDLVWVNTITIPLWILAARLLGLRVVCHSHELVDGSLLVRRLLYAPLFLVHRVIAVSEACKRDIARTFKPLDGRISVVLNPSFSVRQALRVLPGAENNMVVLGRVSARKGLAVLVEALADPRLSSRSLTVHICGTPYQSQAAQAFARGLREDAAALDAHVLFHGYVRTEAALAMGGIVVVPSTEPEACPLVVAEALTAGRAVIASDCGGVSEVAGGAALLVPAGSREALAAGIARIVADSVERGMLREAGLRRARELSPEDYLTRIDGLILDLIAGVSESCIGTGSIHTQARINAPVQTR